MRESCFPSVSLSQLMDSGQIICIFMNLFEPEPDVDLQVLQGGGLESPTKPKGRPKKNSIPSSEQLSEQQRPTADAERQSEDSSSHSESVQEE